MVQKTHRPWIFQTAGVQKGSQPNQPQQKPRLDTDADGGITASEFEAGKVRKKLQNEATKVWWLVDFFQVKVL